VKKWVKWGGISVIITVIAAWWLWPSTENAMQDSDPSIAQSGGVFGGLPAAGSSNTQNFKTGLEDLPSSLRGTEVDGELEVDEQGHLKITGGVRRLFDYFLTTIGEESIETITARLRAYIRHKLPPMAADEAERLLDSYLAYKQGLHNIQQAQVNVGSQIDIAAVRQQMQQVQALRSQFFSPDVIAVFFGDEDAYDRYALAKFEVNQNKSLTPSQRAQQIAALDQELPENLRESLKVMNQYNDLESLTQEWKKKGGTPAELRQIRERVVGAAAADRLEALDKEDVQWDGRMTTWFKDRDAILNNASLSVQDRQQQQEGLRKNQFSDSERVRVEALERIHDRGEKVNP
jgi:lipase chaperone LimK